MNRRNFLAVTMVGAGLPALETCGKDGKQEVMAALPRNPLADVLNANGVVASESSGPHYPDLPFFTSDIGSTWAGFELSDKHDVPDKRVIEMRVAGYLHTKEWVGAWTERWTKEVSRVTGIIMERYKINRGDVLIRDGKVAYRLWTETSGVSWDFSAKRWV